MQRYDLYQDMANRTGGDIYIGVIGGVRTGKSTFIKRFMDEVVLKRMEDERQRVRTQDELPQSASGRTIMTTEPKFIPNEPVELTVGDNIQFRVRMIDCVGYLVPGAEGHMDGELPRMVHTPWSDEPMPFEMAAEMGTKKVINDHSTIGIVVTTDGTITDIPRENYVQAEERVISELKELGKPFVVLLNSTHPYDKKTVELAEACSEQYGVKVLPVNCAQLKEEDIYEVLEQVLLEFPVAQVHITLPRWVDTLSMEHPLKMQILAAARGILEQVDKIGQVKEVLEQLDGESWLRKLYLDQIDLGCGVVKAEGALADGLFYDVLSETMGVPVKDDCQLIGMMQEMNRMKARYEKMESAIKEAEQTGYGIVMPHFEDITLEEPELYHQGSRYGIRLKAKGKSMHLIQADIETEVSPMIGSEEQTKAYLADVMADYGTNPEKIWQLNLFGRSLESLVTEGLNGKLYRMPQDAQMKLQETLEKIINEGNGGLICILL